LEAQEVVAPAERFGALAGRRESMTNLGRWTAAERAAVQSPV